MTCHAIHSSSLFMYHYYLQLGKSLLEYFTLAGSLVYVLKTCQRIYPSVMPYVTFHKMHFICGTYF